MGPRNSADDFVAWAVSGGLRLELCLYTCARKAGVFFFCRGADGLFG